MWRELSPLHHVEKGAPPTIIFHGQADNTVPYATVERFAKA
ncbi:MAG: prolyl oligopeptidase family serine peptidase, partial [Pyrinomonadaceae bacterium]